MKQASVYYQHSGNMPIASRISMGVRRRIFDHFIRVGAPQPETRILDVGVTSDETFQESNFFEHLYPYPHMISCVGTEDGSYLETEFPGLTFRPVKAGEALPFADQSFDWAFSNAVVEHTGSRESQRQFVNELCRVGRNVFVATPNRWFPIEHHTGIPFLHYLPSRLHRAVLTRSRFRYWGEEEHLNILTSNSLRSLFPPGYPVLVRTVWAFGFPANLVAYGGSAFRCEPTFGQE